MSEKGFDERQSITKSLSVIYEDPDIVVYTAPNEDELKDILINLLSKNKRMTIRELHEYLSGLASEDKIRLALNDLVRKNVVVVDRHGYFYLAEELGEYEEDYYSEYGDYDYDSF
ncbi:MAG: ArsR family transcriptional regulator [Desulfurococcales archaeon]|nr:ArsR family transcriptional regulator [Desulfurococcales archaeon]MEB3780439.1 ArsR family transcriptional regulator [Desulfurococcales archaeon]